MDVLPATKTARNGPAASTAAGTARVPDSPSPSSPPTSPAPPSDPNTTSAASAPAAQAPTDTQSLVRRHQAEIWRYVRFLGCEDSLADDIVQETFLAALKKPPTSTDAAAVRAYLRTVARHALLAQLRKSSRHSEVDLDLAEQVWAETHPRDGGEERLSALDDCLGQLEGRAKRAIDLTYRENHSRADIAKKLDMSEDGIKSLLRRTRDALRQCVERKLAAGN